MDLSELERVRREYPCGTPCWFYPAGGDGPGRRGWIKAWRWDPKSGAVATMASGDAVPLDLILIDDSAESRAVF